MDSNTLEKEIIAREDRLGRQKEELREDIAVLYAKGLEVDEVAEYLRVSEAEVRAELYKAGVSARRSWLYKYASVDWGAMVEEYNAMETYVEDICRKYGVIKADFYKYLRIYRPEVVLRSKRGPRRLGKPRRRLYPNPEWDEAMEEYQRGLPVDDIQIRHNIDQKSFYWELTVRGIPRRKIGCRGRLGQTLADGTRHG